MEESVGFVIHGTEFSDKKPMHQKGAVRLLSTVARHPKAAPRVFPRLLTPALLRSTFGTHSYLIWSSS